MRALEMIEAQIHDEPVGVDAEPGHLGMDGLSRILFGHSAFQYLNAACELRLFDCLAETPWIGRDEIAERLGLERRSCDILMLGTTALGLVQSVDGRYACAQIILELRESGDWARFVDTVAFEQHIVYVPQVDFTQSLKESRNVGLARVPGQGKTLYSRLKGNPELRSIFYRYMRSWSELANRHLVTTVDFSGQHVLDLGGGDGVNALALCAAVPDVTVTVLDLADTIDLTKEVVRHAGFSERIRLIAGDMFVDPLPREVDVVLLAHQLVIWTPEENEALLRRSYEALRSGGTVVIMNSMSNDALDGPLIAALDSVYFAVLPAEGGMIYPWAQHEQSLRETGFTNIRRHECDGWTPHGIITATKEPNVRGR